MRQRRLKNIDEKLESLAPITVPEPQDMKGNWKSLFEKEGDLYLEVGCGKGRFIAGQAEKRPEDNFIAIEGHESVVFRAGEKIMDGGYKNVKLVTQYLEDICDFFEEGELKGLYLNFSDPWPKDRHAKRRLTYRKKLAGYEKVLGGGGFLEFKTDNDGLFEFTLEEIDLMGYDIEYMTRDLHASPLAADNVMTEYEEKFSGLGKNINFVKIRF